MQEHEVCALVIKGAVDIKTRKTSGKTARFFIEIYKLSGKYS